MRDGSDRLYTVSCAFRFIGRRSSEFRYRYLQYTYIGKYIYIYILLYLRATKKLIEFKANRWL